MEPWEAHVLTVTQSTTSLEGPKQGQVLCELRKWSSAAAHAEMKYSIFRLNQEPPLLPGVTDARSAENAKFDDHSIHVVVVLYEDQPRPIPVESWSRGVVDTELICRYSLSKAEEYVTPRHDFDDSHHQVFVQVSAQLRTIWAAALKVRVDKIDKIRPSSAR